MSPPCSTSSFIIIVIIIIVIIIIIIIFIIFIFSETLSVANSASNINLSNSLVLLNATNCNVDKINNNFKRKIVCLNVIVVESLQWLSLRHGFDGCDELDGLGGFNGLSGFGGFDGLGEFDGFCGFDKLDGFGGFSGFGGFVF